MSAFQSTFDSLRGFPRRLSDAAREVRRTASLAGAAMLAAWGLLFLWARRKILREFGGVTGDLAGWSIQLCELILVGLLVVLQKSMEEGLLL